MHDKFDFTRTSKFRKYSFQIHTFFSSALVRYSLLRDKSFSPRSGRQKGEIGAGPRPTDSSKIQTFGILRRDLKSDRLVPSMGHGQILPHPFQRRTAVKYKLGMPGGFH